MKTSITPTVGIEYSLNWWHTGLPGGAFIIGIKMKRSAVSQPQQGIEHGAPSFCSWTFAPAPSACCWICARADLLNTQGHLIIISQSLSFQNHRKNFITNQKFILTEFALWSQRIPPQGTVRLAKNCRSPFWLSMFEFSFEDIFWIPAIIYTGHYWCFLQSHGYVVWSLSSPSYPTKVFIFELPGN